MVPAARDELHQASGSAPQRRCARCRRQGETSADVAKLVLYYYYYYYLLD